MRRRFWWHTPLQRALNRLSQRDQARFTEWTTQQFDRERQALVVEANRNDNRRESGNGANRRSEEHTFELQSQSKLVCRLLLEKKKSIIQKIYDNGDALVT